MSDTEKPKPKRKYNRKPAKPTKPVKLSIAPVIELPKPEPKRVPKIKLVMFDTMIYLALDGDLNKYRQVNTEMARINLIEGFIIVVDHKDNTITRIPISNVLSIIYG